MDSSLLAVILCAGKGTRMNDDSTNKVCFEVAGIPTIKRIITSFRKVGVQKFVVVVGFKPDKVMQCLKDESGIVYAYQGDQNGTGAAALCGLSAAKSLGYTGNVIVSAGDKIIDPSVISGLLEKKSKSNLSLVFGVQARHLNPTGGRVVLDGDKVYGIVESPDSALLSLGCIAKRSEVSYLKALRDFGLNEKKAVSVLKKAMAMDTIPSSMNINGKVFTSAEIESTNYINGSLYCFGIDDALTAISSIKSQNAQGEFYLTDMVDYFVGKDSVGVYPITRAEDMLSYSTKPELRELDRFFLFRELKTTGQWLSEESKYSDVLSCFEQKYGEQKVLIARAPGRVNLMGRHIEHRGGSTNVMCTEQETVLVVSPREDDLVCISNVESQFGEFTFSISESLRNASECKNWVDYIESEPVLKSVEENRGKWINYVKAAVLRFQFEYPQETFVGMNIMMKGTVPVAAGLSSSSSIVVATAEALVSLNNINVSDDRFIDLCGEGEWFVGTRGGSGDHAAMKKGNAGRITRMNFKPFSLGDSVKFSPEYRIVVANSFISSKKAEGSKDRFNQKVACYEFGLMLAKKLFPQYSEKLEHLRDFNRIGLKDSDIYRILLALPERVSSSELKSFIPEQSARIDEIQKSHKVPEFYEVRSVMLYGISECKRADKTFEILENGDYRKLGSLMNISHNGDRVWKGSEPYDYSVSDEYLLGLISNLENGVNVEASRLVNQSGGYACSTKEIDALVDLATSCEGVLGAQIAGAGLGGSIIILVKAENAEGLISRLDAEYYQVHGYENGAHVYSPATGSSVLK